jgi:hypothetical protein
MLKRTVWVAERLSDLEGVDQEGTRLATDNGQIFEREQTPNGLAWLEPGAIEPFFHPLREWLPAYILPPRRLQEVPPSV